MWNLLSFRLGVRQKNVMQLWDAVSRLRSNTVSRELSGIVDSAMAMTYDFDTLRMEQRAMPTVT